MYTVSKLHVQCKIQLHHLLLAITGVSTVITPIMELRNKKHMGCLHKYASGRVLGQLLDTVF